MEDPSLWDEDTVVIVIAGGLAIFCALMAFRNFRDGRVGLGLLFAVGALAIGFVSYFFATFQMRMF